MTSIQQKRKGWMIFFLCLYIGLFVIATFYDLAISEWATAHAPDWYTAAGDKMGTAVPTCVAGVGVSGLYQSDRRQKKKSRYLWLLVFMILAVVTGWLLFHHAGTAVMIIGIIITAAVYFVSLSFAGRKMKGDPARIRKICTAIILDVIISMIVVNIIKLIWARPRFLYMDDPAEEFKAWYVINGPALVSDAYKSFPSAHTVSAGTLLGTIWLCEVYPQLHDRKKAVTVAVWCVIIFVAVSRIFAGMHFLSDTLAGGGLAYAVYLLMGRTVLPAPAPVGKLKDGKKEVYEEN